MTGEDLFYNSVPANQQSFVLDKSLTTTSSQRYDDARLPSCRYRSTAPRYDAVYNQPTMQQDSFTASPAYSNQDQFSRNTRPSGALCNDEANTRSYLRDVSQMSPNSHDVMYEPNHTSPMTSRHDVTYNPNHKSYMSRDQSEDYVYYSKPSNVSNSQPIDDCNFSSAPR